MTLGKILSGKGVGVASSVKEDVPGCNDTITTLVRPSVPIPRDGGVCYVVSFSKLVGCCPRIP